MRGWKDGGAQVSHSPILCSLTTGCSVLSFSLAYRVAVDLGATFFNVFGYSATFDKESRLYSLRMCLSVWYGTEIRI